MTTLKSNLLKKGKKGFTLTELAIVIAVIAILIAVLVPTFSSIITKAKVSNESVACKNEWTNFYIDADIAASGTSDDYLVVYTGNSYTDSNSKTYYHGYLATDGVYDTETQYDVTISSSNIATCGSVSYNYVGSYEYMASQVSIYSTGSTAALISSVTFTDSNSSDTTYTVSNSGITISGYGTDYYITGTYNTTSADSSTISNIYTDSSNYTIPSYIFAIRIYFEGNVSDVNVASASDTTGKSVALDGNYYADFVMGGDTSAEYYITYTYNSTSMKITIHNNTSTDSSGSDSSGS